MYYCQKPSSLAAVCHCQLVPGRQTLFTLSLLLTLYLDLCLLSIPHSSSTQPPFNQTLTTPLSTWRLRLDAHDSIAPLRRPALPFQAPTMTTSQTPPRETWLPGVHQPPEPQRPRPSRPIRALATMSLSCTAREPELLLLSVKPLKETTNQHMRAPTPTLRFQQPSHPRRLPSQRKRLLRRASEVCPGSTPILPPRSSGSSSRTRAGLLMKHPRPHPQPPPSRRRRHPRQRRRLPPPL